VRKFLLYVFPLILGMSPLAVAGDIEVFLSADTYYAKNLNKNSTVSFDYEYTATRTNKRVHGHSHLLPLGKEPIGGSTMAHLITEPVISNETRQLR
jgi:hypothetical protein